MLQCPHTLLFFQRTSFVVKLQLKRAPQPEIKKRTSLKWNTWLFLYLCHTAYIFKKAVVSIWRSLLQGFLERADGLIVECLVKAEFFEISHLGVRACWSHHFAPLDFSNLAHHCAHRPCCSIHQQGLTLLEIQDFFYPIQSGQSKENREEILSWLQFKQWGCFFLP